MEEPSEPSETSDAPEAAKAIKDEEPARSLVKSGKRTAKPKVRAGKRRRRGQSRSVQVMEDYVRFVGRVMYPLPETAGFGYDSAEGKFPVERITPLGMVKLPMRRRLAVEKWSPYEVAVFEGAMCAHGKEFHLVQKEVQTKSTKEIVEFYYLWKKTTHYKEWKKAYEPEHLLYADDSDSDSDEGDPGAT